MPGKGRPFVPGDPRQRAGPGRPPKPWRDAIVARSPRALQVLDLALEGKVKNSLQYAAAKDILTWTDPDRTKQKHEVTGGGVQWIISIPHVETDEDGRPIKKPAALPAGRHEDHGG